MNERISLFGLPFVAADQQGVIAEVLERVSAGQRLVVLTINVDLAVKFLQDSSDGRFRAACQAADIVVADGMPIVWASRVLRKPLPSRVAGVDLMVGLCRAAAENDLSLSFLGARPGVAERAATFLRAQFGQLRVAGVYALRWMQDAGVEWAWRLWQEPTRLWRRYLTDGIMFPLYVWKEWRQRTKKTDA